MVVDAVKEPDVSVMVTVAAPAAAVLLAVRVRTLVLVAGLVANAAVTPVGRPVAARVTLPLNGLTSVTVMMSVPLEPCAIDRVDAEGLSVKLPVPPETVGDPVPMTMPRPFVPTNTVPNTCGSPVIAAAAWAYSCAESLICSQVTPSLVEAKIPRTPPISALVKMV